jgi:hypothetical protein
MAESYGNGNEELFASQYLPCPKVLFSVNINTLNKTSKTALNDNNATGLDVRQRNQSRLRV